jgi:hypothetical protein
MAKTLTVMLAQRRKSSTVKSLQDRIPIQSGRMERIGIASYIPLQRTNKPPGGVCQAGRQLVFGATSSAESLGEHEADAHAD